MHTPFRARIDATAFLDVMGVGSENAGAAPPLRTSSSDRRASRIGSGVGGDAAIADIAAAAPSNQDVAVIIIMLSKIQSAGYPGCRPRRAGPSLHPLPMLVASASPSRRHARALSLERERLSALCPPPNPIYSSWSGPQALRPCVCISPSPAAG
eukprot:scaffold10571_cov152-Isochrysis_galbana.AAC.3